ncbi:MAG: phage Gp37/Gp68 family protein [Thermodesulfovibrionales bacterium]
MATKTKIEWTEMTWNPVTGCKKISAGCMNCYAERMAKRLCHMGAARYKNGFKITIHEDLAELPLKWRKPQTVFVNSMSDLFLEAVPSRFVKKVFNVMQQAHWHTFQILTKRAERLSELSDSLPWPSNVWMGVTVENSNYKSRIEYLGKTQAAIKFLSVEPLLGPMPDLELAGIDWVIVGGESGPGARPMNPEWVLDIRDQCLKTKVPFFFKQWGGVNKKKTGRKLEGRTWDELPKKILKNSPSVA